MHIKFFTSEKIGPCESLVTSSIRLKYQLQIVKSSNFNVSWILIWSLYKNSEVNQ